MISFINIASGSKGNATLIYNDDTLILLDMGVPKYLLLDALSKINRDYSDIQGVLITHEHSDHVKTLNLLHDDFPVYSGPNVVIASNHIDVFPEEAINIGSMLIYPIQASHDAEFPLGYVFYSESEKLVYLTDTGVVLESVLPYIHNADYFIFESNHDVKMLETSGRPKVLIERIKGKKGHLSNRDSALALSMLVGPATKAIYLAHLSEECNTPELALDTYKNVFEEKHIGFDFENIHVLSQRRMSLGGDTR